MAGGVLSLFQPAARRRSPARLENVSWVLTILGIVLLIVLHELGHFAAAKAVGMRVERFSLFFPPTIARIRRGETEYAIGAIPLGGYVKITGMTPEELTAPSPVAAAAAVLPSAAHAEPRPADPASHAVFAESSAPDAESNHTPAVSGGESDFEAVGEIDPEITRRAYYNQAPWKRVVVILAGPGVNILIAFLLFWAVLFAGNLNGAIALGNLDPSTQTVAATTSVQAILRGEPAEQALRAGDKIVAIEGGAATPAGIQRVIAAHRCRGQQVAGCQAATPVRLTVRRAGRDVPVSVYPRYEAKAKRMLIGFDFGVQPRSFGPLTAAGAAVSAMGHVTWQTLTGFAHALESAKARQEISSIVGITQDAHETRRRRRPGSRSCSSASSR